MGRARASEARPITPQLSYSLSFARLVQHLANSSCSSNQRKIAERAGMFVS